MLSAASDVPRGARLPSPWPRTSDFPPPTHQMPRLQIVGGARKQAEWFSPAGSSASPADNSPCAGHATRAQGGQGQREVSRYSDRDVAFFVSAAGSREGRECPRQRIADPNLPKQCFSVFVPFINNAPNPTTFFQQIPHRPPPPPTPNASPAVVPVGISKDSGTYNHPCFLLVADHVFPPQNKETASPLAALLC